jgi:N-acetylated-alpha-linked acidic dipeptidase
VYEVWRERHEQGQGRQPVTAGSDGDVPLGVLGSGSDYTPFFHHAGIASLDMGFGGEYGVYHSIYDSFQWMRLHGDPSFAYHATMARIAGIVTLRLAEADLLPFDFAAYAGEIKNYVSELQAALNHAKGNLELKNVLDAAAELEASARRAMSLLDATASGGRTAEEINRALARVEQALLNPEGLAGRPWYKHTVFAPGTYTGYAPVLLPGVREAIERSDWTTAQREAWALAAALRRAAVRLEEISHLAQAQPTQVGGSPPQR